MRTGLPKTFTIYTLVHILGDYNTNHIAMHEFDMQQIRDFACSPGKVCANAGRAIMIAQNEFETEWLELVTTDWEYDHPGERIPGPPQLQWVHKPEEHMIEAIYSGYFDIYFRITIHTVDRD